MPELPPELIGDILWRLPVRSLLRFRCVSKQWLALIDSPFFVETHLDRSIQSRTNLSLILTEEDEGYLYSVDLDSNSRRRRAVVELLDHHPLNSEKRGVWGSCNGWLCRVWGSCNGWLCLSNLYRELILWNPSTRKHRKLPYFPKRGVFYGLHSSCQLVYGFGYDSTSDDYKVVRIEQFVSCDYDDLRVEHSEVNVYSLKSNLWRRVGVFPWEFALKEQPGFLAGGALNWVATEYDTYLIIGFDLGAEEFQTVPKPMYNEHTDVAFEMGVLDGCLCVVCSCWQVGVYGWLTPERKREEKDGIDVWVMEEYGVKGSWSKLISIEHPNNLVRSCDGLKPVSYSKTDRKVLFECDHRSFIWYDLERGTTEEVRIHGMPKSFETQVCLVSLDSLGIWGSNDLKQQAAQGKGRKRSGSTKQKKQAAQGKGRKRSGMIFSRGRSSR